MKAIRRITTALLLIIGLLVVSSAALAVTENQFKVEVNDEELTEGGDPLYVERGEELTVKTSFKYDTKLDNTRVKVWIGGYEHYDVEVATEIFDYKAGSITTKTLKLQLPDDMDSSEDYILHVDLSNKQGSFEHEYNLLVEETRHRLDIQDIVLRPSTVTAGNALFTKIRLENMGDKKEEDIKVTVSIPDLGVSAREYIEELVPTEEDDDDGEPEKSGETPEMKLVIPSDAKTGDYTLEMTVSYNRGYKTLKKTEVVHVVAAAAPVVETVTPALVSVDGSSKEAKAGTEVPFKIMVANLGDEASVFSLEVAGTDLWATTRVEPAMVTLGPDSTGEMFVYVKPKAGAEAGQHSFTAKVKSGNAIVAEKTLTADVAGTEPAATTTTNTTGQTNFASLKNALVIGFGVLIVLLVILGLIIAFNKMNKDKGEEEIPSNEGQAYY